MDNKNIINNSNSEVQDMAFLIVTPEMVGVSTSIDDIINALGDSLKTPGNEVTIKSGEKSYLLEIEHKILGVDHIMDMENGKFSFPDLPQEGLLLNRHDKGERKALPHILKKYIKNILGGSSS